MQPSEYRLASRMDRLGTETAFEVLARAKALEAAGRSILHLEMGEPDWDTAEPIKAAASRALAEGYTHYVAAPGLPELREAIARHVGASRGITVEPEQVVVTPGAKPMLFYSILATVGPGDEVLYPDPGFPVYESVIRFAGATPVPVPLRESLGFGIDLDELAGLITPRTRLLILNSPGNPTGSVLSRADLARVARLLEGRSILVLSDEVYHRFLYDGREHASIAAEPGMSERTILVDGFSKTYAMTGWRLGYAVLPRFLVEPVTRLIINSVSCTAAATQRAGLAALTGPQDRVAEMVAAFRRRRDLLVEGLNRIPGVRCTLPQGAFYAFPNVSDFGLPSREVAHRLLETAGVAVLSGDSFGAAGEGYLRLSYVASPEVLEEALERLAWGLGRLTR